MSKVRNWLLWLSIPIQKVLQKMHPPEPKTTYKKALTASCSMQPGDILLSREKWHFTNLFIPGYWSHAAIFGRGEQGQDIVVESVAPFVREVDWIDWVLQKHSWCVIRFELPNHLGIHQNSVGNAAFKNAQNQIGAAYDYFFDWRPHKHNKAFYCSRLVYFAIRTASNTFASKFTLRKTFGEYTVTPDDFYNACKPGKLTLIHEHRD